MTDHPCITHSLERVHPADRPRRCHRRGVHFAECQHPDTCRGCVPRTATFGLLCPVCDAKVRDALARVGNLILHLRSIDRAGQALGERVDRSAENRIIVPESWMLADGLLEALGSPPIPPTTDMRYGAGVQAVTDLVHNVLLEWADLEAIVSTREGAKRAVVLVKRMQAALARFPDSEVDWRWVPLILCPSCGNATLYRRGPLDYGDELLIECAESNLMYEQGIGYDFCTWRMDWFSFLDIYSRPIEAAFALHKKGKAA